VAVSGKAVALWSVKQNSSIFSMRSDRELLDAFTERRDDQSFTELWSRHRGSVMSVIRNVVGARGEIEDIAQEVFAEFARCAAEIENPGAWLHRVARLRAIDHLRSAISQRERSMPGRELHDAMRTPAWGVVDEVEKALQTLSDTDRRIFVAHVLEGRPQRLVADEVGLDQAVVSRRIERARGRLRRRLVELNPASPALALFGLDTGRTPGWGFAPKASLITATSALVAGGIVVGILVHQTGTPAVMAPLLPSGPVPVAEAPASAKPAPTWWLQQGAGLPCVDVRGLVQMADGRWLGGCLQADPGQGLPLITAGGQPDGFLPLPPERVGNHGLSRHAGGLWAVLARRLDGDAQQTRWTRELWRLDGDPTRQADIDQVSGPIARPAGGIGHLGELTLVAVDETLVAYAGGVERWRRFHPGLRQVAGANVLFADGGIFRLDARGELTRIPGQATMIADGGDETLLIVNRGRLSALHAGTGTVLSSSPTAERGISGLARTAAGSWVVAANGAGPLAESVGGISIGMSGSWTLRGVGLIDGATPTPDGRWWSNAQVWRGDGSWAGWTVDPERFPDDPRLHGIGGSPQACHVDGTTLLLLRHDFGNAVLMRVGRDGIAVPTAAWMVSVDGRRAVDGPWPAAGPAQGSWSWSDANGDGAMQADEFAADEEQGYVGSCWLDSRGGVWRSLRQEAGIRYYALTGFSRGQVPRFAPVRTMPVPAPLRAVERMAYDAEHDRFYATGFTAERPATGDDARWAGSTLVRVDGWLSGPQRMRWQVPIPYEARSDRNISGLTCAGDLVLLGRQRIGEVVLIDAADGTVEGEFSLPSGAADGAAVGWNTTGLRAVSDGKGGYRLTAGDGGDLVWKDWRPRP